MSKTEHRKKIERHLDYDKGNVNFLEKKMNCVIRGLGIILSIQYFLKVRILPNTIPQNKFHVSF